MPCDICPKQSRCLLLHCGCVEWCSEWQEYTLKTTTRIDDITEEKEISE